MMAQIDDDELPGFKEYIQSRNGVDFISSSMMLSAVDAKLRLEMGAEKMFSEILELLRDRYDVIIIVSLFWNMLRSVRHVRHMRILQRS